MIWHIVRFDLSALTDADRREVEAALTSLADIDEVAWLRVAPDVDDPNVVGLLTAFTDLAALERYRIHPAHQSAIDLLRSHDIPAVRLDVETDDDVTTLP